MVTTEDFFKEVVLEALPGQLWDVAGKYVNTGLVAVETPAIDEPEWG